MPAAALGSHPRVRANLLGQRPAQGRGVEEGVEEGVALLFLLRASVGKRMCSGRAGRGDGAH